MKKIDIIRNMNAEELAEQMQIFNTYRCLFCEYHYKREREGQDIYCEASRDCKEGFKAWLESEVKDDD